MIFIQTSWFLCVDVGFGNVDYIWMSKPLGFSWEWLFEQELRLDRDIRVGESFDQCLDHHAFGRGSQGKSRGPCSRGLCGEFSDRVFLLTGILSL